MGLSKTVLVKLEDQIQELVNRSVRFEEENNQCKISKFDREMIELYIIHDMIKSIETYTNDTDELIDINTYVSQKGNLEISMILSRNGQEETLLTEAITAGGHNIQKLHYRYITKTTLPRTGVLTETKVIKEKIKKMTKVEKISKYIEYQEKQIKLEEIEIQKNSKFSDDDIRTIFMDDYKNNFMFTKWEDISEDAPVKSSIGYIKTKEEFELDQEQFIMDRIKSWKYLNIISKETRVKSLKRNVENEIKKLNKLNHQI